MFSLYGAIIVAIIAVATVLIARGGNFSGEFRSEKKEGRVILDTKNSNKKDKNEQ